MRRCLVTGGAGFIGSNVVAALVKRRWKVRVLDNFSTGFKHNLKPFGSAVEIFKGDIRNLTDVHKAMRKVDYVIHTAANRAVLRSVDDPIETNDANVNGTLNVLVAARDAKVKRVVYSSSSSVYGDTKEFPLREYAKPNPQSPYAAQKLMGEYYSRLFYQLYGLETVSLRYFNVFGPNQNPESKYSAVIPIFIDHILKNERPVIHWDGRQSRDFSYVDNVVFGNICALTSPKSTAGQVYNIACHEEYSVLDIFNELKRILGKPNIHPIFKAKRSGDVRRTFADIAKAKKELGFRVQTRFCEGLEKTVSWFLENKILESSK